MSEAIRLDEEPVCRLTGRYAAEVMAYVTGLADGSILANEDRVLGAKRFLRMLEDPAYDVRTRDADLVISLIECMFKHRKGEKLDGTPLSGQPFLLEPWQKFIIYGMLIFFFKGTRERVVKEALIFIPRKNGKTILVAAHTRDCDDRPLISYPYKQALLMRIIGVGR